MYRNEIYYIYIFQDDTYFLWRASDEVAEEIGRHPAFLELLNYFENTYLNEGKLFHLVTLRSHPKMHSMVPSFPLSALVFWVILSLDQFFVWITWQILD